MDEFSEQEVNKKKEESSEDGDYRNFTKLSTKEVLDKTGGGFGSQQFINILFLLTGASFFLIGIVNGLKVIVGNLVYYFIERSKFVIDKRIISLSGIVFGFSFLRISIAIFIKSIALFAFAIIISNISIVLYGESKKFFKLSSSKAFLTEKIIKYSLIITAISLFIAAYLMDAFPISGAPVLLNIFNNLFSLRIYGYLIVFEIAAISFIAAGYILSHVKNKSNQLKKQGNLKDETSDIHKEYLSGPLQLKDNFNFFIKNKILLLLIITNIVVSLVQIIGYSYFGIFIYQNFNNVMFGGFLNVAMVFLISVFSSLIGYFITKINARAYRKFPILIFGIIMIAFMPFIYYFKPDLIFVTIGTIIGVIGGSTVGVTNSLLAIELINYNLRQAYFSFTNLLSVPFFLVFAPILAYIAQAYGLSVLFLSLTAILVVLIIMLLTVSVIFKKELV
jgi:hypothetical protein